MSKRRRSESSDSEEDRRPRQRRRLETDEDILRSLLEEGEDCNVPGIIPETPERILSHFQSPQRHRPPPFMMTPENIIITPPVTPQRRTITSVAETPPNAEADRAFEDVFQIIPDPNNLPNQPGEPEGEPEWCCVCDEFLEPVDVLAQALCGHVAHYACMTRYFNVRRIHHCNICNQRFY